MADTPLYIPDFVNRGKWKDRRPDIWGDSYNWDWVRPWSQLKYVVIHHSVTSHDATPDDIALLHKARGWAGIGYHFVITKDGVVHYVGDISTARANVANMNEQVIGVCLVGDFTKHLPSDAQIESAHDLSKFFFFNSPSLPTLVGWEQLRGHKDFNPTACPGTSFPNDMRDRIIKRLVYTPQPVSSSPSASVSPSSSTSPSVSPSPSEWLPSNSSSNSASNSFSPSPSDEIPSNPEDKLEEIEEVINSPWSWIPFFPNYWRNKKKQIEEILNG